MTNDNNTSMSQVKMAEERVINFADEDMFLHARYLGLYRCTHTHLHKLPL